MHTFVFGFHGKSELGALINSSSLSSSSCMGGRRTGSGLGEGVSTRMPAAFCMSGGGLPTNTRRLVTGLDFFGCVGTVAAGVTSCAGLGGDGVIAAS